MARRKVQGSTVVITGASSGIGQAAALAFAEAGANLVLAARRQAALAEVAEDSQRFGITAVPVPTEVTDPAAVHQLAAAAVERFGQIDVWINTAGVGAVGGFCETPVQSHDQVIRTNLMGYLHGAHAVLPYFMRQRSGVLINTISLGGWVPAPFAVAYTASKFGLRGFSEALRAELACWRNIHVCDVFPAFIDTPGLRHAANYVGGEVKPIPPVYPARDVARAMLSLARRPRREVTVGQAATAARIAYNLSPSLFRWGMQRLVRNYFRTARPVRPSDGNLFVPPPERPRIDGGFKGRSMGRSVPLLAAGLGLAIVGGLLLSGRPRLPGVRYVR